MTELNDGKPRRVKNCKVSSAQSLKPAGPGMPMRCCYPVGTWLAPRADTATGHLSLAGRLSAESSSAGNSRIIMHCAHQSGSCPLSESRGQHSPSPVSQWLRALCLHKPTPHPSGHLHPDILHTATNQCS